MRLNHWAAVVVLLCSSGATDAANLPWNCTAVPQVWEVDQTPTPPSQYGKCTEAIEWRFRNESNW